MNRYGTIDGAAARRRAARALRVARWTAGILGASSLGCSAASDGLEATGVVESPIVAGFTRGDLNNNHRSDIVLVGGAGWSTLPVASGMAADGFVISNYVAGGIPAWSTEAGAQVVAGDFNGDGYGDIAVTGIAGWTSIEVGYNAAGGGGLGFLPTAATAGNFPAMAAVAGAKAVTGDFDGDGRDDIALTGPSSWLSVPVAFSRGSSTFTVTNATLAQFPQWAAVSGAKVLTGDFNGDGRDDIALAGGKGWLSIPVAFSNGDGTFRVTNATVANFPTWAALAGAKLVAGDFDGDGRADIALTGVAGFTTIPVATSNGDGTFRVTNVAHTNFPTWATVAGAKLVAGDFNGDGLDDLALTGGAGWLSVPMAFSIGGGTFDIVNPPVPTFPGLAAAAGVRALSGHQTP